MKHLLPLCALALPLAHAATSPPELRCEVTYAGSTQTVRATPVSNPYDVPSEDVQGRFRFKAVMLGSNTQVEAIKLYTYLETRRQPVLVHQVTHLPPWPRSEKPTPFGGHHFVYAGPVERELQFACTVQYLPGATP